MITTSLVVIIIGLATIGNSIAIVRVSRQVFNLRIAVLETAHTHRDME